MVIVIILKLDINQEKPETRLNVQPKKIEKLESILLTENEMIFLGIINKISIGLQKTLLDVATKLQASEFRKYESVAQEKIQMITMKIFEAPSKTVQLIAKGKNRVHAFISIINTVYPYLKNCSASHLITIDCDKMQRICKFYLKDINLYERKSECFQLRQQGIFVPWDTLYRGTTIDLL